MGKRFMSVALPYLLSDVYSRRHPELRGNAFALAVPEQNRMRICSVSAAAASEGIRSGMLLADARTINPALKVITKDIPNTHTCLHQLALWALRFTPIVAADLPDGLILDISGCAHLWGGEDLYYKHILSKLRQAGFTATGAIADTVAAAWATARFLPQSGILPPNAHHTLLPPLPLAALRIEAPLASQLNKLGLYYIRDVLRLPSKSLRRRFGIQLSDRLNCMFGTGREHIVPVCPPPEYTERLPCPEPIHTAVAVSSALQILLQQLCYRLSGAFKGLRHCVLTVYRVDGRTQKLDIRTAAPTRQESHLLHLFSLRLNTIDPGLGIELLTLEAILTEPLLPGQEILWESQDHSDIRETSLLLDKIKAYLPHSRLYRYLPEAHHWPERSVTTVTDLTSKAQTNWRVDLPRPIHLFHPAREIAVMVPVPDYPPVQFWYESRIHRITKAEGPERIEAEWWICDGLHRDYYCVEDDEGQAYWLYREGHYNEENTKWFLHGLFA